MKNYLFCISFIFFCCKCFSQQANYKITYRHNQEFDTIAVLRDNIGLEAILIGNSNVSNYSFAKAILQKPKIQNDEKTFEELVNSKQSGSGKGIINSGIIYDKVGNMMYQNKKTKISSVREKMENEYILTEEATPTINWEITNETKIIKNYTCKKATTYFRGRNYTAWFTTEVPIVAAPWKFFGLPGLLMDIEDSKHQVKIYVEKIEYPVTEKVPDFVKMGTKISSEKYFTFMNEEFKKMMQGMEIVLLQQNHVQEFLDNGLVKRPAVTSKSALYCIETRLN